MKPKVKISTNVWRDDNDQLETQLIINNQVIDDYCGESYFIISKVLKHLGYEVDVKHYSSLNDD